VKDMKRRKFDWFLSIIGFFQLCVIGVAGALYTELVDSQADSIKVLLLFGTETVFVIVMVWLWLKTK
jgi:hypothetical protein